MRLHTLSATAFGPFAETVTVDFDGLSSAGLFLIRGATGAGKTSLLDAVCFALYASVPGSRPAGRALRSDHAAREAVPSVSLEFTAAHRRFRVTRSPEFTRPKRRGVGETRTQARVELHELVREGWVPRGSRHDEVALVLADVLGMGLDQFSKVVLLPQGDFAAFLRSTAEDRRALLERLFDISRFTGIEEWLAHERRSGATLVHEGRAALSTELSRVDDVLDPVSGDVGDVVEDWAVLAPDEIPARLAAVADRVSRHAAETLAAFDVASAADTRAHQATVRAEGVATLHARGAAAAARLVVLDADAVVHDGARRRLTAAEAAARCAGDLRALQRAEQAVEATVARLDSARELLGRAEEWSPDVADRLLAGMAAHDESLARAQRLAEAVSLRVDRLTAASSRVEQVGSELAAVSTRLAHATEMVSVRRRQVADVDEAGARLGALRADVDRLETLLRHRRDLDAAGVEAARLEALVLRARVGEQDAREAFLDQREARLDGMAGELAATLTTGHPCPVCGSAEHPAPAQRSRVVTAADVVAAERTWTARRSELVQLERDMDAQRQHMTTRACDLAEESRDAAELSDAVQAVRAARDESAAACAGRASVAEAADAAVATVASLIQTREGLLSEQAALVVTAAHLQEMQQTEQREAGVLLGAHEVACPCAAAPAAGHGRPAAPALPAASRDAVTAAAVASRRRSHAGFAAALASFLSRAEGHAEALAARDRVAGETRAALREEGLPTVEEAQGARLPEADLRDLRRLLRTVEDQRAAAEATLTDPEIVAAAALAAPDLEGMTTAAGRARAALLQAREDQALAELMDRDIQRLREAIGERIAELGAALSEHERLARLADTVAGLSADNTLRMRLSSFVLAARLERVAALANERLAVMGDGRYRLEHSDSLAGGGRRSGLGLLVKDLWTGQSRETSTLSGGESFMASLALALGLADAVREESGGFDLQTLFIDEGFGSLDDDSLEQVMSVLDNLRDGGRAVGVVSHVSDLRGRIPCQVSVEKRATGSTVRLVGMAGSA